MFEIFTQAWVFQRASRRFNLLNGNTEKSALLNDSALLTKLNHYNTTLMQLSKVQYNSEELSRGFKQDVCYSSTLFGAEHDFFFLFFFGLVVCN